MPLVWVVFVLGYYTNECGGEVWAQKSRAEISEAAFLYGNRIDRGVTLFFL